MQHYGIKVTDNTQPQTFKNIDFAVQNSLMVEIGHYYGNKKVRQYLEEAKAQLHINMHFNHNEYGILELHKHEALFKKEIHAAKRYNAPYAIIHTARTPMSRREAYRHTLFKTLMENFKRANDICEKENFDLYLENTYQDLNFYAEMFEHITSEGLNHINFCFDIGHAKVWSMQRFEEWFEFLLALKGKGYKLHFHLHQNRGLYDEHLSFKEAKERDLIDPDSVFSDLSYPQMFEKVFSTFPQERKIFEVRPNEAIDNYETLKALL